MAKSVLSIIIETLKKGDGDKQTISALKGVQEGLKTLGVVAGAAAGIYFALDRTIGASIRTYVSYAAQVKQIKDITGESAENTSRLIQVTDDYKITVDDLTKAQKALAGQGRTLSVETLAELSEQYRQLNSGSERQLFLSKEFGGRTGQAFAEMMLEGRDAIMTRDAAVNKMLVLDQEAITKAREYERAQDDLNDAITGYKVAVGQEFVPAATTLIKFLNNMAETTDLNEIRFRNMIMNMEKMPVDSATRGYIGMARAAEQYGQAVEASAEDQAAFNQDLMGLTSQLQAENDNYTQSLEENAAAQAEVTAEIQKALDQGYSPLGSKLQGLQGQLGDLKTAERELAAEHTQKTRQIIFNIIQQKLATDGLLDKETDVLLSLGEKWGLFDEQTADTARAILDVTDSLDALDGKTIDVAINIATTGTGNGLLGGSGGGGRSMTVKGTASGGQLPAGGWALVGDAPGGRITPYSELIGPDGRVYSHEESMQLLGSGAIQPRSFYQGGLGYGDDPYAMPLTLEQQEYNADWYTAALGGSSSRSKTRTRTAARTVTAAVAGATAMAAQAVQVSAQIAGDVAQAGQQSAEQNAQGNQLLADISRKLDRLPELLAAKLAQGAL